ncbi:MAG TPA: carbohydrate binding domain-containing protein, partial [Flavobacterium sp.]|uniref:carbohydrate binding domain-containing protein n=1 Tax=Flavobacterium sp. TaxID=239 RepID=UPI002F3F88E7
AVNGGFETGDFSGWAVYKNGGAIDAITTEPSSGTYSAKLFASAATGLNPTLKQERKAAGTLAVGDKVKITFDYKGALTGESGMYSIQSFVEAAEGVNQVVNITVNPTASWQTYTTTYTVAAGDISGGITLEFVAVCGGVPGCSSTLYIDNVSIIINP